jgi:membrane-associated protein
VSWLVDLFHTLTDVEGMIRWGGYVGLAAIVFAETGLMVGFFLPGDSLLVTAGVFAARGDLDIVVLNVLLIVMAITGDATGYAIGYRLGPALFRRPKSRLFDPKHLIRAQLFYEQHGGKTIVIARFVPILRTFAPVVAGIGKMSYRRFLTFNVFGGIGWVTSMTLLGYGLGRAIPDIDKYIEVVILLVIFLSVLPSFIGQARSWTANRAASRSFETRIRDLTLSLRAVRWEWTPAALQRIVRNLTSSHDATAILRREDPGASHLEVQVDGSEPRPYFEVVAEASPELATLSEAAAQVATWQFDGRFDLAVATIAGVLDAPGGLDPEPPVSSDNHRPIRSAQWSVGDTRLLLLYRRADRLQLSLRVERPTPQLDETRNALAATDPR